MTLKRLVFFDLDGTISRRDTLLPFVLGFLLRRPWRMPRLLGVVPVALGFVLGRADHGELKGALLQATLGGVSRREIDAWRARFLPRLHATGLFADALRAVDQHRRAGDHLVLMSASVDLYVPELAQRLGFDEAICSGVQWRGDRLQGQLNTPNCRGAEKSRCFHEVAGRFPNLKTVAYGNSEPDVAHLRLADEAVLVNANSALADRAKVFGIRCLRWQ